MNQSYFSNYLKTYFWISVSFSLNFLSMFVVTPLLTSNPAIYGVYILCLSSNIFLAYADLGFVGAGLKFASESYAKGDETNVVKIIGFVTFILLLFVLLFSGVMLAFSYNPLWIIKGIPTVHELDTAKKLFFILAVFSPAIILQRVILIIFSIRLEEYISQRINVISSLLKIISVFYFFRSSQYDIVGYFLFFQLTSFIAGLVSLEIARKRYGYKMKAILESIRFSKEMYTQMKSIAFSSLLSIAAWIIFYELDPFVIGKALGADQLAVYAIGLTLMSFLRGLFGILFNPFNVRFNHFIGLNDQDGLKKFYSQVVELTLPITIAFILCIEIYSRPFIMTWVGSQYSESIPMVQILITSYFLSFVYYPGGLLLIAQKRIRESNILSIISMVVFWVGIALTIRYFGLYSFSFFKALVFIGTGIYYSRISYSFMGKELSMKILKRSALPSLVSIVFILIIGLNTRSLLPLEKNKIDFLIVSITIGLVTVTSLCLHLLISPTYKEILAQVILRFKRTKMTYSDLSSATEVHHD